MEDVGTEIIDTTKQIGDLVDNLILLHPWSNPRSPTMYIDLEGVDLCREGSLSIFTLLLHQGMPTLPTRAYLIDVHTLGSQAFNTTGTKNKTLKDILQDEKIPKVFFDVRNDSDALFAHFGVALQGVEDVQLMESAKRTTTWSRKYLSGLAKCVETNELYDIDKASWKLAKEKGERLFQTRYGGSYQIFNQRPIPNEIVSYCVGDVRCLPGLWERFSRGPERWQDLVNDETKKRVAASQKPDYKPHGPNRALAPWSEDQNRTLDGWKWYFDEEESIEAAIEYWDQRPDSCRDIIQDSDYDLYFSD